MGKIPLFHTLIVPLGGCELEAFLSLLRHISQGSYEMRTTYYRENFTTQLTT
jgi:hypothetical protein